MAYENLNHLPYSLDRPGTIECFAEDIRDVRESKEGLPHLPGESAKEQPPTLPPPKSVSALKDLSDETQFADAAQAVPASPLSTRYKSEPNLRHSTQQARESSGYPSLSFDSSPYYTNSFPRLQEEYLREEQALAEELVTILERIKNHPQLEGFVECGIFHCRKMLSKYKKPNVEFPRRPYFSQAMTELQVH